MEYFELNYKNCVDVLFQLFPSFEKEACKENIDLPYMIYGDFALYVVDGVEKGKLKDIEIERVFEFINLMGQNSNDEIVNLAMVGFLEVLPHSKESVKIAETRLSEKLLTWFNNMLKA